MLPASVEVQNLPEGVALVLQRDPSHFRRAGRALVKVGGGVAVTGGVFATALAFLAAGGVPWQFFLEFGLAASLCIGLAILLIRSGGRASVTRLAVDALALSVSDRFLWLHRRVVVPRASIRSIIVEPLIEHREDRASRARFLASLYALRVLLENGKSERFALAYGRDVLDPVAEELARLCTISGTAEISPGERPAAPAGLYKRVPVRLDRPAGSRVQLAEHPDGVTLVVPPGGASTLIGCLLVAAAVLTGLSGLAAVVAAVHAIAQNDFDASLLLYLVVFVGAVSLLLVAIDFGRRRAVLAVVGTRLMVMQSGPITRRRREWDRDQLRELRVAPSGIGSDEHPAMQLQVVPRDGKPFKLLTGRPEPELDWIVALLQRSLAIPEALPEGEPAVEEPGQP